jgi:sugar/nucleoside kinase (ribokinase family)
MPNNGNATPITMNDSDPKTRVPQVDVSDPQTRVPAVDVVGLGLNAMDYITVIPHFPEPQRKTEISEVRLEPGGQVATALTTCSRLGLTTHYMGSVGSDELGRIQIASLQKDNVDISGVRVVEGATSQMAIAMIEEGVGERTIIWHRDPRLTFPPEEVSQEAIRSARILHLDGRDSHAALKAAQSAKLSDTLVVIDIDKIYDETTEQLLGLVDYLIAAEEFAHELTGQQQKPDQMVRALSERFPQAITGITLGPRGAIFMIDSEPECSPAFEVEVRDTTGAGDVFHGAFIFGVVQGWDLRKTIRFAHAVAAIKCTELGARAGIPDLAKVDSFLETATERKLQ